MILAQSELALLKPLYAMCAQRTDLEVQMWITAPSSRRVRIELHSTVLVLREEFPDSPPQVEHYSSIQGVALAYNVPLAKITP